MRRPRSGSAAHRLSPVLSSAAPALSPAASRLVPAPLLTTLVLFALGTARAPSILGQEPQEIPAEVPADADDVDLVTDRPDVTESTSIVQPGWVKLELGAAFEKEEVDAAGDLAKREDDTFAFPASLLRTGISRRVEVRLGWQGFVVEQTKLLVPQGGVDTGGELIEDETSGIGDGEFSVKILLLERAGWRPDIAMLPSVNLPIGEEEFGSDGLDPALKLLLANDLTERVALGVNLGVASPPEGDDRVDASLDASWSVSLGMDLGGRLGGFLEYFGEALDEEADPHSLDGGLTFRAGPDLQLDASGGLGLSESAPDWFAGAGLAFRFAP